MFTVNTYYIAISRRLPAVPVRFGKKRIVIFPLLNFVRDLTNSSSALSIIFSSSLFRTVAFMRITFSNLPNFLQFGLLPP